MDSSVVKYLIGSEDTSTRYNPLYQIITTAVLNLSLRNITVTNIHLLSGTERIERECIVKE